MKPINEATRTAHRSSDPWLSFHCRLAAVLDLMTEDQFLILQEERTGRYLQFAAQGPEGIWAEVVSNRYLAPDAQLTTEDILILRATGWNDPVHDSSEGSPNHHRSWDAPIAPDRIACIAVHTLIEALAIFHPDRLDYVAFHSDGTPIELPALGLESGDWA